MGAVGLCVAAVTDFPLERVQLLAAEGLVRDVRVQLNGNTPEVIMENRRQWERWKLSCPVPLYAFVIPNQGTPQEAAEMIRDIEYKFRPAGYMLDIEKWNEGWNMKPIADAVRWTGKAVIWNCGGFPSAEYAGLDFRRMNALGRMEWQCYSGRVPPEGPTTAEGVRALFETHVLWDSGGSPAWWYRAAMNGSPTTYRWLQGAGVRDQWFDLFDANGRAYMVDRTLANRQVRARSTGYNVGVLQGFTSYTKIGVMLWKSGLTTDQLVNEARTARMDGRAKRPVSLFDVANLTDEDIRRVAAAAA